MASDFLVQRLAPVILISAISVLNGCQSQTASNQPTLDLSTVEMVTRLRNPLVFAHRDLRQSATARDYLYLAPVQANRRSRQSLFLWVGLASTIDRTITRAVDWVPSHIVFSVDGKERALPLESWHDWAGPPPFKVNMTIHQSLRTALSHEDFEWLAQARRVQVHLKREQQLQAYSHWRGRWPEWSDIEQDTAVAINVDVQ